MDEASFKYKSTVGKRILIATRTPHGLPGGSGFHLRNMIECLENNGHTVTVVHFDNGQYDDVPSMIDLARFVNIDQPYDAVIADYSWMTPVLDVVPDGVLKICFVHDLRCRIIPCLMPLGYVDNQGWTQESEAALLRKADVLLTLNEDDAMMCRQMAPEAKIVRIGIAMDAVPHDVTNEVAGRCIYVGAPNLENGYAFGWFERHVWPLVLQEVPHATLDKILGRVDNLDERYAEAQIAVVPHIMNGGLKIKTAEAFAHGLPVVGNVCAFDGVELPVWATDDPIEMASTIIQFLKDDDYRMNMSETLVVSPNAAYDGLLEVLKCV
jgi:glycosyltransferase involved in cell wall biosynthesis